MLTSSHLLFILYVIYDVVEIEWIFCQIFSLTIEWHGFLVSRFMRFGIFGNNFFDKITVNFIGES
jgi:hypothetical protein